MNIQQAARSSGLSADTIRFYEKKGILPRAPRLRNGYRDYSDEHVTVLRFANGLRHLGLSLRDAAPLLRVAHDGTCRDVQEQVSATLDAALAQTEARMRRLARVREDIIRIQSAIAAMGPGDTSLKGVEPCACVRAVSSDSTWHD